MTLAERLSEFVAGLQFDDLPPDVVASVRLRALDILGIALASSTSELAPSVLGAVEGWGGGACSVVGSRLTAASPVAALANGALAHGLDFDDTHAVSITHASSVILPTVLALGEAGRHGWSDGRDGGGRRLRHPAVRGRDQDGRNRGVISRARGPRMVGREF